MASASLKFLSYTSKAFPRGVVGLVSGDGAQVAPLRFPSGAFVGSLYDLIEDWDAVSSFLLPGSPKEAISAVKILAPLTGRDVLAVGKNYKAHAREFQQSGFDSSDKNEQPDFPVIFTKRSSSIVPTGTEVYPHPGVTQTLDYEGELGVIIGKGGIGIKKEDAMKHVFGATIINDFTARERQRDHKQFFIGKSLDTHCPMGPFVVHASELDWNNLILETRVNGNLVQQQNTAELIFDIPTLIETISMGITLQPGDIIATGTPAGVGIGKQPPVFLRSGDKVDVSITGLGVLSNVVGDASKPAPACAPVRARREISTRPDKFLKVLPSGLHLHVEALGTGSDDGPAVNGHSNRPAVLFIHGLGGRSDNYDAVIAASKLAESHQVIKFDLEGHGLSPLISEQVTIEGFADSAAEVLDLFGVDSAAIVGHSMGGLIATTLAAKHPQRVSKLFLIGPVKQFAEAGVKALSGRAETVRTLGLGAVADAVATAGVSTKSNSTRPLARSFVRSSLLSTPAEGYAQACLAIAGATDPDYSAIKAHTLILAGDEDKTSPAATTAFLKDAIQGAAVVQLTGVGHWHLVEDWESTAAELAKFLTP